MAGKADVEKPISLVKPAHAKSVQAIIERAHKQEKAANKALHRSIDKALRPPRGKGLLSKTLGLALSNRGPAKKGNASIRPTAPDTNGRAFHFSHSTVSKNDGKAKAKSGASPSESNEGGTGSGKTPEQTKAAGKTTPTVDLGSKEAGHQRYVERDAALARDATEEFGIPLPGPSIEQDNSERSTEHERGGRKPTKGRTNTRKIEIDVASLQKEIEKASATRRLQSAEAAQAYIEDPTKVVPQTRYGHSNSFGTIGATFDERVKYWNDVQQHEREKDARTQIRLVLELPHEASPAARQEIVRKFCEEYERLGVPYWASIHAPTKKNDDRNHHAHIVHGIRPAKMMVNPETGQAAWDFTIVTKYKTACRHTKKTHPFRQNAVKAFWHRDYVRDTRKHFAETANEVLQKHGCPVRYDPRSYKDMGLDVEPMKHVSRIITDKTKIHDFVVMDPEWTRRMVEREMHLAAVDRDKTYMHLKQVERRLAEATRDVTKIRKVNEKLPKQMKVSPLSRLTAATAKRITTKMLEIEQARIEQRFADEAIERTIQTVLDSTSPTSAHRGGKTRRARPLPGEEAPDMRAMAFLHAAATEEMRLHRIATAGRIRSLGYRAMGAMAEWRREADPAPPEPAQPAPEPKPAFTAAQPPHGQPEGEANRRTTISPQAMRATAAPDPAPVTAKPESMATPTPETTRPAKPFPAFVAGATPSEMAMASETRPAIKSAMASLSSRMGQAMGNLIAMADGPQGLADIAKAMLAAKGKSPAREAPTAPTEAEKGTSVQPREEPKVTNGPTTPAATAAAVVGPIPAVRQPNTERPSADTQKDHAASETSDRTPSRETNRPASRDDGNTTRSLFDRLDLGRKPTAEPTKNQTPRSGEEQSERDESATQGTANTTGVSQPDGAKGPSKPAQATTPPARDLEAPQQQQPTPTTNERSEPTSSGERIQPRTETRSPTPASMPDAPVRREPQPPSGSKPAKPRMLGPDDFLPKRPKFKKLVKNPSIAPQTIMDLPVLRPETPGEKTRTTSATDAPATTTPTPTPMRETSADDAARQEKEKRRKLRRKVVITRNNGPSRG